METNKHHPTIELHPRSDVVLYVPHDTKPHKRFGVSSALLSATSPFFAKLLGPDFQEGTMIATCGSQPTEITLHEDDPDSTEIVLTILHFRFKDAVRDPDPATLAGVAVQCDKFLCTEALEPWITRWFLQMLTREYDDEDYGHLLRAAYLFKMPSVLRQVSCVAIKKLTMDFEAEWQDCGLLENLPRGLIDAIKKEMSDTKTLLRNALEDGESLVRGDATHFPPRNARCTPHSRVGTYFEMLSARSLWPAYKFFETSTVEDLESEFSCLSITGLHRCTSGCTLSLQMKTLSQQAADILENIQGVDYTMFQTL